MTATTLRPLRRMAWAMRVRPGRLTRRGISRGAGNGGRDRTVQRVFSPARPWAMLWWVGFRQPVHRPEEVSRRAGDAVVVTTAGQHPDGLERFCASLSGQPSPGVAFVACSRVRVHARRALPVRLAPVGRRDAEQAASTAQAAAKPPQAATPGSHQGGEPVVVQGQWGLPSPGGWASARP